MICSMPTAAARLSAPALLPRRIGFEARGRPVARTRALSLRCRARGRNGHWNPGRRLRRRARATAIPRYPAAKARRNTERLIDLVGRLQVVAG